MKPVSAPTAMKTVPVGALDLQIYGLSPAFGGEMLGVDHVDTDADVAVILGMPVLVVLVVIVSVVYSSRWVVIWLK